MKKKCKHEYPIGFPGEEFQWCRKCGSLRLWREKSKKSKGDKITIVMIPSRASEEKGDGWMRPEPMSFRKKK